MFGIGPGELIVILVLALIIFGPGKLPEVGRALGKTMREFKKAASEITGDDKADEAEKERKIEADVREEKASENKQ